MAGSGKSTIARTVAHDFACKGQLAASFFFSRGGGNLGNAVNFVTTIAIQLAKRSHSLKRYICEAVHNDTDIASQGLRAQWNKLILSPLSKLCTTSLQHSLIILIDALDECEGEDDTKLLLQLLAEAENPERIRLQAFLTSRPETPISLKFRTMPRILHHDLVLHDVSRSIVDRDISVFFNVKFREIRENFQTLPAHWPGDKTIGVLVQKAAGLFIYAATICRFIKTNSNQWPPRHLLQVFLTQEDSNFLQNQTLRIPSTSPTAELDTIYTQILNHSMEGVEKDADRKELAKDFKRVIGSIALLSEPLSAIALGKLLNLDQDIIHLRLRHLCSVLDIPDNPNLLVRMLHPSFRDFLLDKERCSDVLFWIDEKEGHQFLMKCCHQRLTLGNTSLKKDICNLQKPGILTEEVSASLVEQYLPIELQYACRYWVQHLKQSGQNLHDDGQVHQFLLQHLLHWLEALSLIGKTSDGIHAIELLESIVNVRYA